MGAVGRRFAIIGAVFMACVCAPLAAKADDERVLLNAETSLAVPAEAFDRSPYTSGGTLSAATLFSVTKWLMPLLRVRGTILGAHGQDANPGALLGTSGSLMAGLRFRPRGIAHPEEVPRATCIWAEIDAGVALFGDRIQPTFEVAIGFAAEAGPIDIGPVVRFVHVFPTAAGEDTHAYAVTLGLEVIAFDARPSGVPHGDGR
jgi:hypothetical protein